MQSVQDLPVRAPSIGTPALGADGCRAHGIEGSVIPRAWDKASELYGSHLGVCCCCGGPTPMVHPDSDPTEWRSMPYCKRCGDGETYEQQHARAVAA